MTNQAATIRDRQAKDDALEASIMVERRRGGGIGPGGSGDPPGTAASIMAAHVGASDPHAQYATDADLGTLANNVAAAIAAASTADRGRANHTGTQPAASTLTMGTARIIGRATAGAGNAEELTAAQVAALLGAASGTFTPTGATILNCSALTLGPAMFIRFGNVVTVSGEVTWVTVTAASTTTSFRISLPIASNLAVESDASGVAGQHNNAFGSGSVTANVESDMVTLSFLSAAAGIAGGIKYHYSYRIL